MTFWSLFITFQELTLYRLNEYLSVSISYEIDIEFPKNIKIKNLYFKNNIILHYKQWCASKVKI